MIVQSLIPTTRPHRRVSKTGRAQRRNLQAPRKRNGPSWVNELHAADVPCGPIYSIDQIFVDPKAKHHGIGQDVPNAENRNIRMAGQPVALSRLPSKLAARLPEFGEQTEVLVEFGVSADEI